TCQWRGRSSARTWVRARPLATVWRRGRAFIRACAPTQMGLTLNIDMAATAFLEPLMLPDFVMRLLNRHSLQQPLSDFERVALRKGLRGVRIEVTHRGQMRRKYKLTGLTTQPLHALTFPLTTPEGETQVVTVEAYFRQHYNLALQLRNMPCATTGQGDRLNYLPLEVCRIVEGQRYNKKLNEVQTSQILVHAARKPFEREREINQTVRHNAYERDPFAAEFGIRVAPQMATVNARVLPTPTLKYSDSGGERTVVPQVGAWNMMNKRVLTGAVVRRWALVNLSRLPRPAAEQFGRDLAHMCNVTGLQMEQRMCVPMAAGHPGQMEAILRNLARQLTPAQRPMPDVDIVVCILNEGNGPLYGNLKRLCETELGIVTQCCLATKLGKGKQYLANVALKINAKVGGRNTALVDSIQRQIPLICQEYTILFGADVTHPAPGEDNSPSIAAFTAATCHRRCYLPLTASLCAVCLLCRPCVWGHGTPHQVVASMDWPEMARYRALVSAQAHRVEIIQNLYTCTQDANGMPQHGGMVRYLSPRHPALTHLCPPLSTSACFSLPRSFFALTCLVVRLPPTITALPACPVCAAPLPTGVCAAQGAADQFLPLHWPQAPARRHVQVLSCPHCFPARALCTCVPSPSLSRLSAAASPAPCPHCPPFPPALLARFPCGPCVVVQGWTVSDGQFAAVKEYEGGGYQAGQPGACASLEESYNPLVTFAVVQKRHHTRFFPFDSRNRSTTDRSGNALPGTVIDTGICHPTEFDFYLLSHSGIQGTSRPTHYHVVHDENGFDSNTLQRMTYSMAYTYARCTRAVSVAITHASPPMHLHPCISTHASPPMRLHPCVSTHASPPMRLHPCISTHASPPMHLHPCISTHASPPMHLHPCISTHASPPMHLHPCISTHASPPMHLHPCISTHASPPMRLHPCVSTHASPPMRLHPCISTHASPPMRLHPCVSTHASPPMRLHPCISTHASPPMHLHPCVSTHASPPMRLPPMRLHPCISTHASPPMHLHPCISTHASPPMHLHPCIFTHASPPMHLHPCISTHASPPMHLHPCISTHASPPMHLHPCVSTHASPPMRLHPCISTHASPPMHLHPCISTHASPPMHLHPCISTHASPPMHLRPCISTHASPPMHLHPCISTHASPPMHLHPCISTHASHPCISTHASPPMRLHPCVSTHASPPMRLHPCVSTLSCVSTHASPPMRLHPCVSTHASPPMRLHPCVSTHASPPMRLHPCVSTHASPPMRLHPCVSTHASPPMHLHPCISTHASPPMRLHPCVSTHASPPMRLHPCVSTHASPPMRLHPCISTHASPPIHLHPCVSTHASPPTHLHPCISTHASPPMHLHPCISNHASPPMHLHPSISTHASPPMHLHPCISTHASPPMHLLAHHRTRRFSAVYPTVSPLAVPPAYYAHIVAFRARFYMDPDQFSDSGSQSTAFEHAPAAPAPSTATGTSATTGESSGSRSSRSAGEVVVRPLPPLQGRVREHMFFC
ncbi:unnamed protein product, partial [Closterium sp. Naga37s-1]